MSNELTPIPNPGIVRIKKMPIPSALLIDPKLRNKTAQFEVDVYLNHQQRLQDINLGDETTQKSILQQAHNAAHSASIEQRQGGLLSTYLGFFVEEAGNRFLIGEINGSWSSTHDMFNIAFVEIVDYRDTIEEMKQLKGQSEFINPDRIILSSLEFKTKMGQSV